MSATPLVIIGAGGSGREVHEVVAAVNQAAGSTRRAFEVVGFVADGAADIDLLPEGTPFLGNVETLLELSADVQYVVAIGSGAARRRIDEWATSRHRVAATVIHPAAVIGSNRVSIGPGTVICATAVVNTNVRLGRHVHLNVAATISHDAVLRDYVTVSPNVSIAGKAAIEREVTLGIGSAVIPGRRIGARTVVGAGAVVTQDLPADVTAVGVPARPLR